MNNRKILFTAIAALVLVTGIMMPGCARPSYELTPLEQLPAADGEGWITLFDGKTLDGWQNARQPGKDHFWTVEDGAMVNDGDNGRDLATVANFKDFELQIEYKTIPHGNSGVYLRGRVEVQILDSHGKEKLDMGDAGAVYDQYVPLENASLAPGEWHKFEIRYVDDKLTVKLNDKLVQDNVTISKETGGALRRGVNEPGPIMLQGDHGKTWFRNVRIKPIGLK
jgi:hypothetical protein